MRRKMNLKGAKKKSFELGKLVFLFFQSHFIAGALFIFVVGATAHRFLPKGKIETDDSTRVATEVAALSDDAWSYFHPAWKPEPAWPVDAKIPKAIPHSTEYIYELVGDPDERMEREFRVPPSIRDRVAFWMEIYSRYNSQTRVIHDRNNPGIVWGYVDLRPIYRALGKNGATETKVWRIDAAIAKELKARILEAGGVTKTTKLTLEEKAAMQKFLSRFGGSSPQGAAALVANVRSQSGQSDMFLSALYRSRNLLPHIEAVFRVNKLPVALARIPFVESSFNHRAESKVGAVGLWQFMPATARQMIARDEKLWKDPLKQTASAAKLFHIYRSLLPDWGMVVTSYNSGVGRVRKLSQKHKARTIGQLLAIREEDGLGFAGRNFYSEFLAANLVESYKEELFNEQLGPEVDVELVFKDGAPLPQDACGIY